MKKLPVLLFFLITLCLLVSSALAQTEGDFLYTVRDGKAEISGYTGSACILSLPDTLGGYPVASVGAAAFKDCAFLTQVILPEGVASLKRNAFEGCTALAEINIPDSLVRIDDFAFRECSALKQLNLHDNMEFVNLYAFYGCPAIRFCSRSSQTALTLNNSAITFCDPEYPQLTISASEDASGDRTFAVADCDEAAAEVRFPEGVVSIGNSAFYKCTALTQITLPDGVADIGYYAFRRCTSLNEIIIPDSVQKIGDDAFAETSGVVIAAPAGSAGHAYAQANGLAWRAP